MDVLKPTLEKKKKKMTTKRTQEIIRRRSTMVTLAATRRTSNLEVTGGEGGLSSVAQSLSVQLVLLLLTCLNCFR